MILISHRGNIDGVDVDNENHPSRIKDVLKLGYDVEIDAWLHQDKFYLGHDEPKFEVDYELLCHPRIWVHAKNLKLVEKFKQLRNVHWFWHEGDKITLTNYGYVWCYPGSEVSCGIAVDQGQPIKKCYGVCSDNILEWKTGEKSFV
tara:strand:+ start:1585 stop:2022 length:438 start_codon:yes stop_codon:yes gene_type:complete